MKRGEKKNKLKNKAILAVVCSAAFILLAKLGLSGWFFWILRVAIFVVLIYILLSISGKLED